MNKILFFSGLTFILSAIMLKITGCPASLFLILLFIGVSMKSIFLFNAIKSGAIKKSFPLNLLLTGVALALVSLLLKYQLELPIVAGIVLFIGVVLKITSLVLFKIRRGK